MHTGKKESVTRTTERVPKPPLAADFVSSVGCPLNVEDQERVSSYLMGKVDYEYQELQMQVLLTSFQLTFEFTI